MSLKTKQITITAEGRDQGKVFLITEKPAGVAEKWGWRAYLAMARAGLEVPPEIAALGLPGLMLVGLRALSQTRWEDAEPLLDEMMDCVRLAIGDAGVTRPPTLPGDIWEWSTFHTLRMEVVELHLGFTIAEGLSRLSSRHPTANSPSPSA